MSYAELATAVIGRAVGDIGDHIMFGNPVGKSALEWVRDDDNEYFKLYSEFTVGPDRMKENIEFKIKAFKEFKWFLKTMKVNKTITRRRRLKGTTYYEMVRYRNKIEINHMKEVFNREFEYQI